MTILAAPNTIDVTVPDKRVIHLTQDMSPSLAAIPMLYFVVTDSEFAAVPNDAYMLDTIPATSQWDYNIKCFSTASAAADALQGTRNRYTARIFSASGPALAQWFSRFTIGTKPVAIENIPIDFHFVRGAERIHPETFRKTELCFGLDGFEDRAPPARKIIMTGPHGAGKSTLAKHLSDCYNIPVMPSYAGPFHKLWGITADVLIPFERRIQIQRHILMKWRADYDYACRNGGGIFDRAAYDIAAYLLADVDRDLRGEDIHVAVNGFVNTAMRYMREVVDDPNAKVIYVPMLVYGDENRGSNKAPPGAYATLFDTVILGLISMIDTQTNPPVRLALGVDDLHKRLDQITSNIEPIDVNV